MSVSLKKILVVDDEKHVLSAMRRRYHKKYNVITSTGGREAVDRIETEGGFAVVISDLQMPGMNGLEFLQLVRKISPDSICIMLTGFAELEAAVEAVNQGHIFRFLTKPCADDVLDEAIGEAVEEYRKQTSVKSYTYSMRLVDGELIRERSGGCLAVTGYSNQDFYRDEQLRDRMILPEFKSMVEIAEDELLAGYDIKPIEFQVERKDGKIRWLRETIIPHRDADGQVIAFDGHVEDITEKKEIQKALIASEARYQRLVENSPGLVFEMQLDSAGELVFTFVSESARQLFGLAPDSIRRNSSCFTDGLHEADKAELYRLVQISSQTLKPLEWWGSGRFQSKMRLFQAVARPEITENRRICWHGLLMDMTDLRKLENHARSLARLAAENPNPIIKVDAENTIVYANHASIHILDLWHSREGQPLPDDVAESVQSVRQCNESRCIEMKWCKENFALLLAPVEEEGCVHIYVSSIDHIKDLEEKLRACEQMLCNYEKAKAELSQTFAAEVESAVPAIMKVLENGLVDKVVRLSRNLKNDRQIACGRIEDLSRVAEQMAKARDLELGLSLMELAELAKEAAGQKGRVTQREGTVGMPSEIKKISDCQVGSDGV